MIDNLDGGLGGRPDVVAKPFPDAAAGRKGRGLLGGKLGANGLHEIVSLCEGMFKVAGMSLAFRIHEDVVGQNPRFGTAGFGLAYPWPRKESDEHHREGTTLGDARREVVGFA